MPSVVVGFACPMKRLMSNGGMPAATHKLAYAWRREWNFSSGDSAAVGVSLLARNKRGGQADFSSAVESQPLAGPEVSHLAPPQPPATDTVYRSSTALKVIPRRRVRFGPAQSRRCPGPSPTPRATSAHRPRGGPPTARPSPGPLPPPPPP